MPATISHRYVLLPPRSADEGAVTAAAAADVDADTDDADDDADADADADANAEEDAAMDALWRAMQQLPPAPALVFVDKRFGARRTAEALRTRGLRRVTALPLPPATATADSAADGAAADGTAADGGAAVAAGWEEAEVYVGTERWGRGLDLRLCYVFVLSPPASTASYVHMAGRTGRQGAEGTCVTLLEHRQAPRLVAFAEALGVPFRPL